jgi:hypothetical protein
VRQNHQDVAILAKTILLTSIYLDTTAPLYPQVSAINDTVIRDILPTIDIHSIKNSESQKNILIPEMYLENLSDNAIILEWWVSETEIQPEIKDKPSIKTLLKDQQIEYRFSHYHGCEGLSQIIDRGKLLSSNNSLNLGERNRLINKLIDFLQ